MLMIGWKPATNDGGDLSERVRPEILARDKVDAAVVAVDQLCDLPIAEAGELADGVLVLAWHLLHCGPSAISPSSARAHTNCVRTPRCLTHRHSPVHLRLIPEVGHPAEKLIGELRSLGVSVSSQVVETRRNTIFGPQQMDRLLHHAGPIRSPGHAPSTGSLVPEGRLRIVRKGPPALAARALLLRRHCKRHQRTRVSALPHSRQPFRRDARGCTLPFLLVSGAGGRWGLDDLNAGTAVASPRRPTRARSKTAGRPQSRSILLPAANIVPAREKRHGDPHRHHHRIACRGRSNLRRPTALPTMAVSSVQGHEQHGACRPARRALGG